MYVIYSLMDPRDDHIFYIGITLNVFNRFLQHITCEGNNMRKNIIITELRADNRLPILEELERVEDREAAEEREMYWIGFFLKSGDDLTNVSKSSLAVKPPKKHPTNLVVRRDAAIVQSVVDMHKNGMEQKAIGKLLKMSQPTVSRILAQHRYSFSLDK